MLLESATVKLTMKTKHVADSSSLPEESDSRVVTASIASLNLRPLHCIVGSKYSRFDMEKECLGVLHNFEKNIQFGLYRLIWQLFSILKGITIFFHNYSHFH